MNANATRIRFMQRCETPFATRPMPLAAMAMSCLLVASGAPLLAADGACGPRDQGTLLSSVAATSINHVCREPDTRVSAYACDTPELRLTPDEEAPTSLVLTPETCGALLAPAPPPAPFTPSQLPWVQPYTFWHQCINAHEQVTDFLVMPGDYTNWGRLDVYERDGNPQRKRVIRYWGQCARSTQFID